MESLHHGSIMAGHCWLPHKEPLHHGSIMVDRVGLRALSHCIVHGQPFTHSACCLRWLQCSAVLPAMLACCCGIWCSVVWSGVMRVVWCGVVWCDAWWGVMHWWCGVMPYGGADGCGTELGLKVACAAATTPPV
eukprot:scaffold109726_cov23-Tisochrysis_lutea.AAC.2